MAESGSDFSGSRHRVVIVGAGFGGLAAARKFRRADVEVTVVDRRNFHLFQPLLYQVATGGLSPAEIASPIRKVLRKQPNTRVLLDEVVDIDVERRLLVLIQWAVNYFTRNRNARLIEGSRDSAELKSSRRLS